MHYDRILTTRLLWNAAAYVRQILPAMLLALAACTVERRGAQPATFVVQIPKITASSTEPANAPTARRPLARSSPAGTSLTATRSPQPTATFTPRRFVAPEAASATATFGCNERSGSVTETQFRSQTTDYPMRVRIYLPPCYDERPDFAFPALYLLHGRGHTQATWDELGADEAADALISTGQTAPFIIVMPREVGGDDFGAAVVADLVPFVGENFRTMRRAQYRALGGMSRGAGWALSIGLQNPRLFGALGLHSLAILYSYDGKVAGWLDAVPPDELPRLYLDIGQSDGLIVSAEFLHQLLADRNIEHEYILNPGGHSDSYWESHVEEYLRWYADGWPAAPLPYPASEFGAQE